MSYVDASILDLTERICRRFQRLTGRSNVWVAFQLTNLSIVLYFVWAALYLWRADTAVRVVLAVFCAGLWYLLTQTIFKESIEASENRAYRRAAQGLRNPRRVRDAMLRLQFLILSLVLFTPSVLVYASLRLTIALLGYSLIVLVTVLLYVLACDPLPPCAGTLREWARGLFRSRALPSGATEPTREVASRGRSAARVRVQGV